MDIAAQIYQQYLDIAAAAKLLQSFLTLCDSTDGSPPGSPIPGILQTRTLECFLLQCMKVKSESEVTQSCPTFRDPMDCSLPGSSIHGIFQARVLEWSAIVFSDLWILSELNSFLSYGKWSVNSVGSNFWLFYLFIFVSISVCASCPVVSNSF